MKRRFLAILGALIISALALMNVSGAGSAQTITPYPAALATGHPYGQTWTGRTLAGPLFNDPQNAPGNCPGNPAQVHLLSNGNVELWTSGAIGNCTSIQSPHEYPTAPGYVYEVKLGLSASSVSNWPSFWGYGSNWPNGGEIDAYEMQFHTNYTSWHYPPCNNNTTSSTISTNPWTYDCKTNLTTKGANISTGPHIIDYAFTTTGIDIYYDGHLYTHIPETLTATHDDPFWITVGTGSCESANNGNVCQSQSDLGVAGNVQIAYVRIFT